ncbi:DUF362 domain-containing protein [Oscillibacter sp. MSJ-2]|uniref:DUF362 domain-containing protein n=1 Tax=Dysosmobacter acutus TaxID=2841504 RepID=A0ABS6F5M0_9FIRM|nr:DUF362 domain-containing protein [Dysosmobacter acutus]MBU5625593.1 DUF362 domain-containing protein [Dysosmobacter acutus]
MDLFKNCVFSDFAAPTLPPTAYDFNLPRFHRIRQEFPDQRVADIDGAVDAEFQREAVRRKIKRDDSVALLVGSRGICSIDRVVRRTVYNIQKLGGRPFIVPAMGSHGNGEAQAQKEILEGYGVTEEAMGCPIRSSMETVLAGYTEAGLPAYADKNAAGADVIVPICRVKCHTDFHGPYESGICKMLAIGLGKHKGCSRIHQETIEDFPRVIPSIAQVMLDKLPVGFAIALIENAHEHLYQIRAVCAEEIMDEEPGLLQLSKSLMPRIQFRDADILIVNRIGKDITGAGMDPNITGRKTGIQFEDYTGPRFQRIIVNGLTEASHGNAIGLGLADFTTFSTLQQINFTMTYTNCTASGDPQCSRLPLVMKDEETALRAAIATCTGIDRRKVKVIRIPDTLHLTEIEVSSSLLAECGEMEGVTVLD